MSEKKRRSYSPDFREEVAKRPAPSVMNLKPHSYYEYFNRTYKIMSDPEGQLHGFELNLATGEFDNNNRAIARCIFATSTADISNIDETEFIDETEQRRAEYLRGDGPIFAIYETIDGMYEQRKAENRRFAPEERALIKTVRQRTFTMWVLRRWPAAPTAKNPPSTTPR